jgi:hypothetical protein
MAIIRRIEKPLSPPTVGVLNEDLSVYTIEPGKFKPKRSTVGAPGTRVYASWDTIESLLTRGIGEALTWGARPIRWRRERIEEDQWHPRPTDVSVLRVDFPEDDADTLAGLGLWRDWLCSYGARPTGSLGGSAMSLLRATIPHDVWTMRGEAPPISATLGSRQHLAVEPGTSISPAQHFDLPAAYPTVMGELCCNGIWRELTLEQLAVMPLDRRAELGPLILEATVTIPELPVGPLPDRPTVDVAQDSWEHSDVLEGEAAASYPVGCELTGVWSWAEIREALLSGCTIETIRGWWLVNDGTRPFAPWLRAVKHGRELEHRFAALLAKASSNAAWGSLVIGSGARAVVWYDGSSRQRKVLPAIGGGGRSWDLAELICGSVRAELARMMRLAGTDLVTAHTDGGWVLPGARLAAGWVRKDEANRLDVIGPQMLRYWRPGGSERGPLYAVAGWPQRQAAEAFEAVWSVARKAA